MDRQARRGQDRDVQARHARWAASQEAAAHDPLLEAARYVQAQQGNYVLETPRSELSRYDYDYFLGVAQGIAAANSRSESGSIRSDGSEENKRQETEKKKHKNKNKRNSSNRRGEMLS